MTSPAHLLSVAGLLLASFLVGAVAGSLLRLIALQIGRKPKPVTKAAAAETTPAVTPLVAAPHIAPLPAAPEPTVPTEVPVPDFTATMLALAADTPLPEFEPSGSADPLTGPVLVHDRPEPGPSMQPARVAGETTSGVNVPSPLRNPPRRPVPAAPGRADRTAEVIPFPGSQQEPDTAVSRPAAATIGGESVLVAGAEGLISEPIVLEPAASAVPDALQEEDFIVVGQDFEPLSDKETKPALTEAAAVVQALDEDAAMRAIEGNWTPRRPPRTPSPPAGAGANQAVAASARAVATARRTAEAIIADVAAEAGRPQGLTAPRDGKGDDLTHIIGVLPVIATAFHQLGIYHFDQVAALTDENAGWIEAHLGLPGRISRELWREQARELSAALAERRRAES